MNSSTLRRRFSFLLRVLAITGGLLLAPRAQEAQPKPTEHPFLWRVEGVVPTYLFGTLHFPDERITTLHPEVEQALDQCEALFTEMPMDNKTMGKMAPVMMLPRGKKLADMVPAEVLRRLEAFFAARHMTLAAPIDRMKPWALTLQVLTMDHLKEFAIGKVLDMELYRTAKNADKEVGGLETLDEQIRVFEGLSDADNAAILAGTIDLVENLRQQGRDLAEEMVKAYVAGSGESLMKFVAAMEPGDKEVAARYRKAILVDRNATMVERIVAKLKAEPKRRFFFAVGAAHFFGEQGIIAQLRAQGYTVTRLPETAESIDAELRDLEQQMKSMLERIENLRQRRLQLKRAG